MVLKAQVSTEFLAFMAISIAMLTLSAGIYSMYSESATRTQRALEAQGICIGVSTAIGSFASLGEGATGSFSIPKPYAGANYTVRIAAVPRAVKVEYSLSGSTLGVGCHYPSANLTNRWGASAFEIAKIYTLKNNGTVILVGP